MIVKEAAVARIKLFSQGFNRVLQSRYSNPTFNFARSLNPDGFFGIEIRQIPDPEKPKYWGPSFQGVLNFIYGGKLLQNLTFYN